MFFIELLQRISPVLMAGLVFGAGLPALYAVAARLLSARSVQGSDGGLVEVEPSTLAKGAAYLIFALLGLAILSGILWIAKDFLYAYTGFNFLGAAG